MLKILFFIFAFCSLLYNGQNFRDYRLQYDNYEENDERAFKFLNLYISQAKKEKNYRELTQAYRDAVSFSRNDKIAYADSAITAAKQTSDPDILGSAYLTKGTVYYFNYKKFSPALDEYLKAWKFLEHSEDKYLHFKNLYHIGVVKRYLGYYVQSLVIFEKCIQFYGGKQHTAYANEKYNLKKGYLNSLHQSIICLNELKRYDEAIKKINSGLTEVEGDLNFYLERSYLFKTKGVAEYHQGKYNESIASFRNALSGIEKKNDFASASLIYFYKGKSLLKINNSEQAYRNFQRIDSVFVTHAFVLPEVRPAYEILIAKSSAEGDIKKELYYTNQLLKVDKIIASDFKYLAGKIFKEFDTKDLIESKEKLEESIFYGYITVGLVLLSLIIIGNIIYLKRKKSRDLPTLDKSNDGNEEIIVDSTNEHSIPEKVYPKLSEQLVQDILAKLQAMEEHRFFLEKGFTLNKLAKKFKTNTTYLSAIINEYKGNNFNTYLNTLRIEFAAKMIAESKVWRSYSVETIASECGFTNRSNFSKIFTEIKGVSPNDFILQYKDVSNTNEN